MITSDIREIEYFSPAYPNRELLEAGVETNWDASTASQLARCPRNAEYHIRYGLVPKEDSYPLAAGKAVHEALSLLYAGVDPDCCLEQIGLTWTEEAKNLPKVDRFSHLSVGFLETVFKNYLDYAKRSDSFQPLRVPFESLNLEKVLGATFRVAGDSVILGESKIIMDMSDVVGAPFVYSGKPDLPVLQGGSVYIWDHKSTSSYLSTWYFEQYRFSNQLRGYAMMASRLLNRPVDGALINGIYVGERAALSTFNGEKFGRFGPMLYSPAHLQEAILNQYHWRKALDYYDAQGYYPQHAGKMCSGCSYQKLCALQPLIREATMQTDYKVVNKSFLDL